MTLIDKLKTIQLKIGNVGVDKLYNEAKKQKVEGLSREAVKLFLSTDQSKQLFKPLPESKGKTASEGQQFRLQVDLIDLKFSPSKFRNKKGTPQFRYILVLIDVMSRFVWTAPLVNKMPGTVEPPLRRLINSMDKKPVFIFSDKGNEFTGEVATLLEEKGIIHKTRAAPNDMNVGVGCPRRNACVGALESQHLPDLVEHGTFMVPLLTLCGSGFRRRSGVSACFVSVSA